MLVVVLVAICGFHDACHNRGQPNCSEAPHLTISMHHPATDFGKKVNVPALPCRLQQIDAEAAKTRAHYAAQQARVGSLEAWCTHEGTATGRHSRPTVAARSNNNSRISAMRSLVKNLREEGVCVHGLLADLVLLRRECDRKAVAAVIGPALWTAVVVQARRDGARVVAAARAAGITGKIRCDVLDEMKKTMPMATSAGPANGGSGLITLSECVATADPLHFPAAVKYLRGWYVSSKHETRTSFFASRHLVGAICLVGSTYHTASPNSNV